MMANLKTCPFCGGVATQIFSVYSETYVYGCLTNGCMGNAHKHLCRYNTDKEAIEAWNKRVPQTVVNQFGENCTHIDNCGTLNLNL